MLARGEVQFVSCSRPDFSRQLLRGERPRLLVEADATDPAATGNALAALAQARRSGARARPDRPAGARSQPARAPFDVACSAATTRKASRSTTSCRACSA